MMQSSATTTSSANSPSLNAEKCVNWVREQAKLLIDRYFLDGESNSGDLVSSAAQHAASVLERLIALADGLKKGKLESIDELAKILSSPTNVSCFELLQSGLIGALAEFLVQGNHEMANDRLTAFCKAFFGVQVRF
jgi:hypothetical protein